jgi:hypothetical protein
MQFYDNEAYNCQIRNPCTEIRHWHTIKPNRVRRPGNFLGFVVPCEGDLEQLCERLSAANPF